METSMMVNGKTEKRRKVTVYPFLHFRLFIFSSGAEIPTGTLYEVATERSFFVKLEDEDEYQPSYLHSSVRKCLAKKVYFFFPLFSL